jgi:hypothetical protein
MKPTASHQELMKFIEDHGDVANMAIEIHDTLCTVTMPDAMRKYPYNLLKAKVISMKDLNTKALT